MRFSNIGSFVLLVSTALSYKLPASEPAEVAAATETPEPAVKSSLEPQLPSIRVHFDPHFENTQLDAVIKSMKDAKLGSPVQEWSETLKVDKKDKTKTADLTVNVAYTKMYVAWLEEIREFEYANEVDKYGIEKPFKKTMLEYWQDSEAEGTD